MKTHLSAVKNTTAIEAFMLHSYCMCILD